MRYPDSSASASRPCHRRVAPRDSRCARPAQVTGGVYESNRADFGGFLYKDGDGDAACVGVSVFNHTALNGGAVYILDGATLDWQCDLAMNDALTGPGM